MVSSLSRQNQFRFVCPIFNLEVKFAQCVQVRENVYAGKHLEVRKGCQACVSDSKCPVAEVVRKFSFHKHQPDDYGADTPVVGKIRKDVLEKIAPVMVMQRTMDRYGVPSSEQVLIASSSERIHKLAGTAPMAGGDDDKPRFNATARKPASKKKAAPQTDKINQAAATGDLAAAINA